jgi:RNA polymerase sigma factor (sigma-70 family)
VVPQQPERPASFLDSISTQWTALQDSAQFAERYGPAIRNYLERLLRNRDDAEDIAQEFLVQVVQQGFAGAKQERGKFRHYLKVAVRNAALDFLRKRKSERRRQEKLAEHLASAAAMGPDEEWLEDYRQCLLKSVWQRLRRHQDSTPGNLLHRVLQAAADQPDADSRMLAAQISRETGKTLTAEAFRQQLHRARRLFAAFLVEEVSQTVEPADRQQVDEELAELGLREFVAKSLPRQGC